MGPIDKLKLEYQQVLEQYAQLRSQGLCVTCKKPALPKCYSDAGRREYTISGCCEACFDRMFAEAEAEEED